MSFTTNAAASGLWFEDFEVGRQWSSAGRTVTESDIGLFAGLTGDYSQVHTDEEYCRNTAFGTRIAHGLLGLSIAQGLMWRSTYTQGTAVASLGWDKWAFKKPIQIGDTVHVSWNIQTKRESRSNPAAGLIVEWVELINQRGEVTQQGEHTTMIRKRPF